MRFNFNNCPSILMDKVRPFGCQKLNIVVLWTVVYKILNTLNMFVL